eukprot:sb/3467333/
MNYLSVRHLEYSKPFYRAMSETEKALFEEKQKVLVRSVSENRAEDAPKSIKSKIKDILSRVYVISFCVFAFMDVFQLVTLIAVTPFFMHDILDASTEFISYTTLFGGLATVACTLVCIMTLPWLDKRYPWFWVRLCFMTIPQILRTFLFIGIAYIPNKWAVAVMVIANLTTWGTIFSGSIVTVNYEIDPKKAPITLAVINGVGQLCGFIVPLLRAAITNVEKHLPLYRERWQQFYCLSAITSTLRYYRYEEPYVDSGLLTLKHHSLLAEETVKKEVKGFVNLAIEPRGESIVMENKAALY